MLKLKKLAASGWLVLTHQYGTENNIITDLDALSGLTVTVCL